MYPHVRRMPAPTSPLHRAALAWPHEVLILCAQPLQVALQVQAAGSEPSGSATACYAPCWAWGEGAICAYPRPGALSEPLLALSLRRQTAIMQVGPAGAAGPPGWCPGPPLAAHPAPQRALQTATCFKSGLAAARTVQPRAGRRSVVVRAEGADLAKVRPVLAQWRRQGARGPQHRAQGATPHSRGRRGDPSTPAAAATCAPPCTRLPAGGARGQGGRPVQELHQRPGTELPGWHPARRCVAAVAAASPPTAGPGWQLRCEEQRSRCSIGSGDSTLEPPWISRGAGAPPCSRTERRASTAGPPPPLLGG